MQFRLSGCFFLIFISTVNLAKAQSHEPQIPTFVTSKNRNSSQQDQTYLTPHYNATYSEANVSGESKPLQNKTNTVADFLDQPVKKEITESHRKQIAENVANLPISFRKNMGQWDDKVLYRGSSPGWNASINFMKNGLSFGFSREQFTGEDSPGSEEEECMVWNLNFKGGNANVFVTAEGKENSHISYIHDIDINKQQLNVPDYRMIMYNELYNNIDLRYYTTGKKLKYDYIIQPGGNMKDINMACEGIEKLIINEKGQLEITTQWGTLLEELPESYQIINGKKKLVQINYKIIDRKTFGFTASEGYTTSEPLVIDPVTLVWCTMLASAGDGSSYMQDIAIDAASNVYGVTDGTPLYPTTAGTYSSVVFKIGYDTYVFKFNSTATALIWGTFVSTGRGNNTSDERSIALDGQNNVYIVGRTCPACGGGGGNLITTPGAYDVTYNGPPGGTGNAYFLKLNNTGSTLLYSSYLGSAGGVEKGEDIAVSSTGLIYVTGSTQGATFPVTAGAFDVTYNGGGDIFLSVINPAGAGAADLVYSTFIGGSTGGESGISLAIDPLGRACISGSTSSGNFPTTVGAYSTVYGGAVDAFVCKINPGGSGLADLVYSTFLGGAAFDNGTGIVVNAAGEVFLAGNTASANFPVTAGAYDVAYGGTGAIFALKLSVSGTTLLYSTYVEGVSGPNIALSSASCDNNEVFISATAGTSPPITSCAYRSTAPGAPDVIVLKLKMAGGGISDLLYSTYFGGNVQDYANLPICANAQDEVFVAYTTHSSNTPTTAGVFGPNPGGAPNDISVVFKLKPSLATLNYTFAIGACNNTVNFTGTASGTCIWQQSWTPNYWLWDFGDGLTSALQNPTHVYSSAGTYNVKLLVGCPKDSITKTITITPTVGFTTSFVNPACGSSNGSATATPTTGTSPFNYSWSNGQTTPTATGLSAGSYTVKVTDLGGCSSEKVVVLSGSGTLNATIAGTNATCTSSGNAVANVSGGSVSYTYTWSNGQVSQTATGLAAGAYTATVTDASGCIIIRSVTITQPAPITATITGTKQATCNANNGNATVTVSNGTSLYIYSWSNSQTSQTAINLAAGNYTVTVRDVNGCSSTQKAVITAIPPSSFTVTPTNGTCGNGGNASTSVTGGTLPYIYSWSGTTQTGSTVTGLVAGSYSVTLTDGNGCSSSKTFNITDTPGNNATFSQSPAGTVCVGTSVTFTNTGSTGSGITYNWVISPISPANVSGTTTDFSYTFLTTGTFSVQHTVSGNGCNSTVTKNITIINCSGPNVTATGTSVCPGSCATVSSSGTGGASPYMYSWNTGATTQNINPCPASTTTYTVTITDSGGATATSAATVTINPAVSAATSATNISCNGANNGSATVNPGGGTSPYTYSWSNAQTSPTITGLIPGSYTVTVTDSKGCTSTSTSTIISPPPLIGQFTKGTTSCTGCGCKQWIMVTAGGGTGPYSYAWPDGYANRYKNQLCPGTYSTNITDKNGCSIVVNLTTP